MILPTPKSLGLNFKKVAVVVLKKIYQPLLKLLRAGSYLFAAARNTFQNYQASSLAHNYFYLRAGEGVVFLGQELDLHECGACGNELAAETRQKKGLQQDMPTPPPSVTDCSESCS